MKQNWTFTFRLHVIHNDVLRPVQDGPVVFVRVGSRRVVLLVPATAVVSTHEPQRTSAWDAEIRILVTVSAHGARVGADQATVRVGEKEKKNGHLRFANTLEQILSLSH